MYDRFLSLLARRSKTSVENCLSGHRRSRDRKFREQAQAYIRYSHTLLQEMQIGEDKMHGPAPVPPLRPPSQSRLC